MPAAFAYEGPAEAIAPEPDQAPTGSLRSLAGRAPDGPSYAGEGARALDELAAAGWGEGDTEDPHVPEALIELHEILEWQAAVRRVEGSGA